MRTIESSFASYEPIELTGSDEARKAKLAALPERSIYPPKTVTFAEMVAAVPPDSLHTWSWWPHIWNRPNQYTPDLSEIRLERIQKAYNKHRPFVDAQTQLMAERNAEKAAVATFDQEKLGCRPSK